jgi:uncharacterized protein YhjY with autotransporter beta-barrel domain
MASGGSGAALVALKRSCLLFGLMLCGLTLSLSCRAECGGSTQCIGVGRTATDAITDGIGHHGPLGRPGTPDPMYTADFGTQVISTTSTAQTVFVAAVTGPAGTVARLGTITITGANASEFAITGGNCATTPLVQDGQTNGVFCTITVAFRPTTVGAKTARLDIPLNPLPDCCISGRSVALAGSGVPVAPSASPTTMTVPMDTPTTADLAALIGGTALQGVRIVTAPAHGTATLSGTTVTYTPNRGYLGPDTFTYQSFSATASSPPATVTVSVVARPDPTQDPRVTGLLNSQAQTARRFSRAQVMNFQRRMESLHRVPAPSEETQASEGSLTRSSALNGVSVRATGFGEPTSGRFGEPIAGRLGRPPAGEPAGLGLEIGSIPLLAGLVNVAATGSLNLERASSADVAGQAVTLWAGGNLQFGTRDQTSGSSGLRFGTEGISIGVDRRFSDRLVLGLGLGYANDQTDIGTDGSKSRAKGSSIAVYGSYQPTKSTFIDGVLGYGTLRFDTDRFVPVANDFARAHRTGDQLFASVAAGYELRANGVLLSPYGRLDLSRDRLKQATENGAGLNALTYLEQTLNTAQVSLGLRAESQHATSFGWALPRVRLEFRHDLKRDGDATIAYADQFPFGGPLYSVSPVSTKRSALLLGIGSDFILRDGLRLGIDYQTQRLTGVDRAQAVRLWIAKDLDGRGLPSGLSNATTFVDPVNVQASYTWDSNVTRGRDAGDRLSDRIYGLNVGQSMIWPLGANTRFIGSGFVNGEKFRTYEGLDRVSIGAQGELQYRGSGEFGTPTFGAFGRIAYDEYHSGLRGGERYSLGITYRQLLTDRISLFGALAHNERSAQNDVFSGREVSARVNADYTVGPAGTIYLGAEYRRGDAFSTGFASAQSAAIAKIIAQEDAFGSDPRFVYRFEAETTLWTLGWNVPLGPRDGIDFSLRRIDSSPTARGTFTLPPGPYGPGGSVTVGKLRYSVNQFSAAYLMRF